MLVQSKQKQSPGGCATHPRSATQRDDPLSEQSLARSGHETNQDHPGYAACYEVVVYGGYIIQDEHGEEHETFDALPCHRCQQRKAK
jgi:hypothetical protein